MPERQSSPGEVTSRPETDATENGNGTGAGAGGNGHPAAPSGKDSAQTGDSGTDAGAAGSEPAPRPAGENGSGAGGAAGGSTPDATTAIPHTGEQNSEQITAGGQAAASRATDSAPESATTADATSRTDSRPDSGSSANGGSSGAGGRPSSAPRPSPRPSAGARPPATPRPSPRPPARPEPSADRPTVRTPVGDESPTVRTPAEQPTTAVRRPAPGAPAPSGSSWFTSADAEETQVLPRMPAAPAAPAAQAPRPAPAAEKPDPATEVIPVTRVAPAAPLSPPSPPPPDVPDQDDEDGGAPRRRGRRALLVTAVVVGALALLYAGDMLLGSGSVPRGVTVAGVAVGGLPLDEAEQRLRAEIGPRTTQPIPVSVGEATSEIDPVASGLTVDWPGTMAAAGEQPLNPITRVTSFFTERPVPVVTTADQAALNSALEELAPVVDREPVEGTVKFEGTDPQPVDPVPGQKLNVPAAAEVLRHDWASGGPVALPLTELPATSTPDDVRTAIQEVARPAVSAPVTVIGENGVRGTVTPEVIASALSFRAENGALVPELNKQAVQDALAPQMAPSERPGRDATLDFSTGSPVIVPSQDGRGVDYEKSLAELLNVLTGSGPREITAVYADQPAEVTTEEMKALGNPQVIGEFNTGGFARDSGVNIRRAAELINGIVVQPGETFSLDAATGPRTAANGYVEAGVIDNGAPGRGMAGGVSQVSTTLYNAAYFAGMTIIEHKPHSFYISRYPAGREATIATGAIDNRWRNDNPTPVLIRTAWTPTSVTVWIYGQRQWEVTGAFGPRTNPTQPNTVTIPPGRPCNPSNGAPGFTITDTRTLRNVGTGEVRSETYTTKYNPAPRVVCS